MKNKLLFICFSPLLIVSCKNEATIIGHKQTDEKCNPSTGYQWSSLKKECIRVFEQPIQLKSVAKEPMETICAVIFNEANDQAEVFAASTVILAKISVDNFEGIVASTTYNLKKNNGRWQLLVDGNVTFSE
jgi:hypothetical protein